MIRIGSISLAQFEQVGALPFTTALDGPDTAQD